ncbi:D-inositol-3-phosphate glycosyltransferase [subsurface metagenome]
MKILVTTIVDPEKSAPNRLLFFIKHLYKNHKISIISVNDWWKARQTNTELYNLAFKDVLQHVQVEYFTKRRISPILQEIFSVVTLGKALKEVDYRRFDVHLNYGALFSGHFVAKKMKSVGVNTVFDVADNNPQMIRVSPQIPSILRPLGGIVGDIIFNKNIKIATKVTYVTQHLRDLYPASPDKSEIIPNGVDTQLFKSHSSEQLKQQLGVSGHFVVGFVGVLREWVDFEPIFAAVSQLNNRYSNIKVLIVGEEGGLNRVRKLASEYQISDRVIFAGTVPHTKVPDYISCMDVGVIPFKRIEMADEPCPVKLFEYMACEKPVISSQTVSMMRDKVLYAPDSEEYKRRIVELYENKELRTKLGKEGRKFVAQNHSWEKLAKDIENVLLEAAS